MFKKVNDEGGINGRKINFVSYDDAYSPPKAVEQARKLVESDEVLLLFGTLGTASNTAIQKYLNAKKVPQLFVATGATKWNDPKTFRGPWAGCPATRASRGSTRSICSRRKPAAKVAVLYQNDDMGKDYLKGLEDGFASDPARMVVAKESYEVVRADHRSPRGAAEVVQPRCHHLLHHAEIRRPGDQEARRDELEAGDDRLQRLGLHRDGDAPGRARQLRRASSPPPTPKDASDPQWKDDAGMKAFDELLGQVLARHQSRRCLGDDRLQHGDHAWSRCCAAAVTTSPAPT